MTFVWFVMWLIANNVGGHEALTADPVNAWLGTLILAGALDTEVDRPGWEALSARRGQAALRPQGDVPLRLHPRPHHQRHGSCATSAFEWCPLMPSDATEDSFFP